ncbi:MAG TPA: efflux RND transporter periplasmic adaptor subunit [Kofleriaceae bacterium]|nr:efflux RND transporter periplasmic adaptor subunit [Kofleriaceae bacterium]
MGLCVAAPGCRSSDEAAELPPATGKGAADPVKIPDIPTTDNQHDDVVTATVGETTGTTYPIQSAQVAAEASGVLATVAVDEGDAVKKGQLLFRLQTADLRLQLQRAEAARASTRVNAEAARVSYERTKRLHEKTAVDDATWDKTQAGYLAAQAAVKQADVGVAMAKKQLSDATVKSPITGVVTRVLHEVGESVSTMPPTVVVVVEDHSTLELRFHIPEQLIPNVKVGDPIAAEFRAVDISRQAQVTRISPSVDARTRTVEVVANIDNHDGALKSGMLAVVDLSGDDAAPAVPEPTATGKKGEKKGAKTEARAERPRHASRKATP